MNFARTITSLAVASTLMAATGVEAASPTQIAESDTDNSLAHFQFSGWAPAIPEQGINDPTASEGCPIESPDGLHLFIASNRAGTLGANDVWVSHRLSKATAWSLPQNLGMPVNSGAADYCPTPINDQWLMFVSERPGPDTCNAGPGSGDMYIVHLDPDDGWGTPQHLGCAENGDGPNTSGSEFSPSWLNTWLGAELYFSSNGYNGNMDIYMSRVRWDGSFAPAVRVDELSTEFDDRMPNVRKDGLEIVFSSNRPGGSGGQDVYVAARRSTYSRWSAPVNLGPNVNTAGSETRASLSGDGRRLHFGRDGDIFVSTRGRN